MKKSTAKFIRKWWWLLPILILDIWLIAWWQGCFDEEVATAAGKGCAGRGVAHVIQPLALTFPTPQTNLWATNDASVFMPTGSGRVQSALYGSTRTRLRNGRAVPAFHEGIDIAPMRRDSSGRATDEIFAVADGKVGYANRSAGASSYGRYVVLEHRGTVGPVYSLYAHMSSIADEIRPGNKVERGQAIGIMGNSSTLGIPRSRAHLHLEAGLMLNRRFEKWLARHEMDATHGIYHGWNLTGIDPLALYPAMKGPGLFCMLNHLRELPTAFKLAIRAESPVDYFRMYAPLWQGDGSPVGEIVLSVCSGAVITAGRPATPDELQKLGAARHAVIHADREVLGRNGPGLIAPSGDRWNLTSRGQRWLDILME